MNYLLAFVMTTTVACASKRAQINNPKMGYVDFESLVVDSPAGRRANAELQTALKKKKIALDHQQKALQELGEKLHGQRGQLDPQVLEGEQMKLQRRYVELQQAYVAYERELVERRKKLFQQIVKQTRPVIIQIARDHGYTVIIDRSSVIWATSTADLTDAVKAALQ